MGKYVHPEQQYLDILAKTLKYGKLKTDPQGVGNLAIFGEQMRFKPSEEFPIFTTRNLSGSLKAMVYELKWFLSGSTKIKYLNDHKVHLWDSWATKDICEALDLEEGDLGPIYGELWTSFPCGDGVKIDQIATCMEGLKTNPDSRRWIVSSWNPNSINKVFVAPCHCFYHWCHADGVLNLHLFQRSADLPVGIPFNVAEYSLLLLLTAQELGFKPGEFIHTLSDAHIYLDQVDLVKEQLKRKPMPLPKMSINPDVKDIFSFELEDLELIDYKSHPKMNFPVAL